MATPARIMNLLVVNIACMLMTMVDVKMKPMDGTLKSIAKKPATFVQTAVKIPSLLDIHTVIQLMIMGDVKMKQMDGILKSIVNRHVGFAVGPQPSFVKILNPTATTIALMSTIMEAAMM